MTPVYKLSANSVKNGRTVYGSMLAGNTAFTEAAFESIASVSGTGSSGTITFSSIPSTYSHLQVRAFMPVTSNNNAPYIRFNSDSGNNYTVHTMLGASGQSTPLAQSATAQPYINIGGFWHGIQTTYPAVSIVDILDYSNGNKYKTIRALSGQDNNASLGSVGMSSGLWLNNSVINTISIILSGSTNFGSNARFGLYGIKA
jgi:hypothetical protein